MTTKTDEHHLHFVFGKGWELDEQTDRLLCNAERHVMELIRGIEADRRKFPAPDVAHILAAARELKQKLDACLDKTFFIRDAK